jgi:pyruvate formate lyase activating enzyme
MNIDVKAFRSDFYKSTCRAELEPVLSTCRHAIELGIFIELTYLVIPTQNDDMDEIGAFCRWVVENLGEDTPVHFSRFHPDYKMRDLNSTPMSTLGSAYETARSSGLNHVYLGNVPPGDYENTYCPKCGKLLIERRGFSTRSHFVSDDKCPSCGSAISIIE